MSGCVLCWKKKKKKQNKMTYEELILHTGQLLQSHPEILRPLWLIIDEVQDCDQSQLDLLDSLMGKDSHLFAVGDPNQVIYSWRGSAFQIFFQLKKPLSGDGTQPSDQLSFFWDDFICSKTIFAEWKYAGRGKKRRR